MQLRTLAGLCNANDPYRGPQTPNWVLADRLWLEEHSPETLTQVLLEAAATSAPAKELSTYHGRDDVMLLAFHRPVPSERVESWSQKCPVVDLVERKFGAWHEWLMKGQPADSVPAPPVPPSVFNVNEQRTVGAALYKMDESKADMFETATLLYPADHTLLRYAPSGTGQTLSLFFRDGGYAAMRKPLMADTCDLSVSFEDGARASIAIPSADTSADLAYGMAYGGLDGVQCALDVLGITRMTPPPLPGDDKPAPAPAAILSITGLTATGVPDTASRPEGGDVYVRITALEVEPPPGTELVSMSAAVGVESADGPVSLGDAPALSLPAGAPRPTKLRVELWDTDCAAGGTPLAAADLDGSVLPASGSGALENVELAATAEGGEPLLLSLVLTTTDVPSLKPKAPPREVARTVLRSGTVVVKYVDGTLRCLLRDGNVCERAGAGSLANIWVSTNSAGLRAGTQVDGSEVFVAPVPVASSTDPITHHVMTTRGDGTLIISRSDGSRLVQFEDGTTIDSSAEAVKFGDRGEVRVNKEGYPPVRVSLKLLEVELSCLDGTMLKAELAQEGKLGCVKLNHLDGTVLKLSENGATALYPAPLAWVENADGKSGVYHLDLAAGTMYTKDPAGSSFRAGPGIEGGHQVDLVMADDLAASLEDAAEPDDAPPNLDEENPDWSHPPRLFVVRADGSGVELLRSADCRGFTKQREAEIEGGTAMLLREPLPSEPSAEVFTYVWRDWMQMHIASLDAERRESDAVSLLGFQPKVAVPPTDVTTLNFRRLLRREPLSEGSREQLEREIDNMNQ